MMQMISVVLLACSSSLFFTPEQIPEQQLEAVPFLTPTTEDVTRIYFIQNAESEYSAIDENGVQFTSGRSPNVALSELGKDQALRLGALLPSRIDRAVVFMPPAKRAVETAEPFLSEKITVGPYYEGLFEVGMGDWEGKPKDFSYKAEYQKWKNLSAADKYRTPKVEGGESYERAAHRAMKDLNEILQSNSEKTIFIVSGDNVLNALAIQWKNPPLSEEMGSDLPMLSMEKGDFFLVEVPRGHSIEQAEVKMLFHTKDSGNTMIDDLQRNVRAIIFDCDGVLVDTEFLKFLAWQEALASQGIEFSTEEYLPLVGHSSVNILQKIRQLKKMEISDEVIGLKNARYTALQKKGVPAIEAMVDFARYLSAHKSKFGLVLGLASSAPREEILANLRQIGLENAFDLVISGSDDLGDYGDPEGKNKPKPYIYMEASKRLRLPPESCLVFEDTTAGIDAAAEAGMIPIAIPNSFTRGHDFSKAAQVLSSHEELSLIWKPVE